MKYSHRRGFQLFLVITVFLTVTGCGGANYTTGAYGGMAQMAVYDDSARFEPAQVRQAAPMASNSGETWDTPTTQPTAEQTRKLVKRANLRLRVEDPATLEKPLADIMKKFGAWSASTGVYENSRDYSIRVPAPYYEAILVELSALGRVIRRNEHAEDVTLRYYDLEGRLATRRELLRTYQGYLGRARNIDEIMTVESRIADLQHEIDWAETQFRNLASLIDYSTIDLEIIGPPGTASLTAPSLREKMRNLFGSFGDMASSALVVLTGIVIYGIPAAIIIILLFWLLFGRIGLIKRLWRLAMKPPGTAKE